MAWTTAGSRSGMGGYEWHATHSEPGFRINQRELLQISNHGQQNQRGCLLSTGPLYYLYLSQGKPVEMSDEVPPNITLEYLLESREIWNQLQIELASLSSRGSRIVAAESGHRIHSDQPDLLVDAVDKLVQVVRQKNSASDPLEQ